MYTLRQVKEIIDSEFPSEEIEELITYCLDQLPISDAVDLIETYLQENE